MSSTLANNLALDSSEGLSREKLQQLLAAVGSEPAEDATQIEAAEYDFHQPHYFNSDQLNKLNDFTKEAAAAVAGKFAQLYRGDFNVTITSTTQHFAAEFLNQTSEERQSDYYLAFGTDRDHTCGLIGVPPQTAVIWTTQLLGDTESEKGSDRNLSQLEESILLDITSALVEVFSKTISGTRHRETTPGGSDSYESGDFHPAGSLVRGRPCLLLAGVQGTEELCKITFSVEKADSKSSSEVYVLIFCSRLEPVAGKTTQAGNEVSAEDISKAILDHVQQMTVSITAQLASTMLTFEEIMGLQPGDVLLLDRKIDEPIDLIVEGRRLFQGRPAKSAGKHAMVITESSSG